VDDAIFAEEAESKTAAAETTAPAAGARG